MGSNKIYMIRNWCAQLETIKSMVSDTEIKNKLSILKEKMQYSDPMSTGELSDIENRIGNNISLLREEVEEGNMERVLSRLNHIQTFLIERNERCRALKR